jgi:hypothetical protein
MVLMMILYRFLAHRLTRGSPVSRHPIRRDERLPPQPRQFTASGNRFKPEEFTDDPALQQQLRGQSLNFELMPPGRYREVYDQIKQRELTSYGLISKRPGEVHIPIDEAKRLLVEREMAALPGPQPGSTPADRRNQWPEDDSPPTSAGSGRDLEKRKD